MSVQAKLLVGMIQKLLQAIVFQIPVAPTEVRVKYIGFYNYISMLTTISMPHQYVEVTEHLTGNLLHNFH